MPLIFFSLQSFFGEFFKHMPLFLPGMLLALSCLVAGRFFFVLAESRRASYRQFGDHSLERFGL
jgi:hypothetical protein